MKSCIVIVSISLGLLLSVQSCLTCTKCKGNTMEAKCIKPNDTLIFSGPFTGSATIHRYYSGGDSIFYLGSSGYDHTLQRFQDSGYVCTSYITGVDEVKGCNQAGERDDNEYHSIMGRYSYMGYDCYEYKGH